VTKVPLKTRRSNTGIHHGSTIFRTIYADPIPHGRFLPHTEKRDPQPVKPYQDRFEVAKVDTKFTTGQIEQEIKDLIHSHEAMHVLETAFGTNLKRAPLSRENLKTFLACHIAGVRDVPTSILTLATRLSHECMKIDYFGGHAIGARILFAAVHEYGLQNTEAGIEKTHFELYRDAIHSWGFTVDEILKHEKIFPACSELCTYNETMAQTGPVAKALGCHFALEITADREFYLLWEGFSQHWKAYGLTGMDDPALGFYNIHIIQEPLHGDQSREALIRYLSLVPHEKPLVMEGVSQYLEMYTKWIKAFQQHFFT